MAARGAPPELIAGLRAEAQARAEAEAIQLLPDDFAAWQIFSAASGQWRWHPGGQVQIGLDYVALEVVARMLGVAMTPDLFHRVQMIEAGALQALLEAARARAERRRR